MATPEKNIPSLDITIRIPLKFTATLEKVCARTRYLGHKMTREAWAGEQVQAALAAERSKEIPEKKDGAEDAENGRGLFSTDEEKKIAEKTGNDFHRRVLGDADVQRIIFLHETRGLGPGVIATRKGIGYTTVRTVLAARAAKLKEQGLPATARHVHKKSPSPPLLFGQPRRGQP